MKSCNIFSIRVLREPDSAATPLSQLMISGEDVGQPIEGACLEQQYFMPDLGYLLFLTDNVPYEETLRIYLVDKIYTVIDGLEFGGNMVTGELDNISIKNSNMIEFSFIHNARCRLQINDTPKWCKPLLFTPGVRRSGGIKKRYMALDFIGFSVPAT